MLWSWWGWKARRPGRGLTTEVKFVRHMGRLTKKVGSVQEERHRPHRNQKLPGLESSSVVEHLPGTWDSLGENSHNVNNNK